MPLNSCRRQVFHDSEHIFVPAHGGNSATWAAVADCLWNAPSDLTSKFPLKERYKPISDSQGTQFLSIFFQNTLSVRDASWRDLVAELQALKAKGIEDLDQITEVYKYLSTLNVASDVGEIMSVASSVSWVASGR